MSGTSGALTPENFNNFGELLRYLRERAELSQRELALQVGYHYSYMSRIEKNERMPDSATLMARFIPALGLDDEPHWTERLLKLVASEEKTMSPRRAGQSPASHPSAMASSLPSFDSPLNLLPLSLTPLLGREDEVEALTRIIARPEVRLVTLVGAPGVGKTRLAIHTANNLAGLFAHGAAFADLSPVAEPKDVLPALANAIGVHDSSDVPLLTQVVNMLRQKNLLFVIDNFEHVIDASPQLVQLLGNAPQVKVLVTSREALRISGEQEFAVMPLPVPEGSVTGLIDYAAVQLFAQRAQAVEPNFRLTPENLRTISEICRRLDGLPLAIELAAARAKFLTPQAMLAQFDRRLDWVAHGTRDAASPRQTLRGAIAWSFNTLSDAERVLFRRLAVFSGSWNASSAEAICGADERKPKPDPLLRRSEILNLLIQLTDKSIVLAEKFQDETRFRFLETIHEYAREKLQDSGEAAEVRNRHLAYYANLAETMETGIDGADQLKWIRVGDQEHNNIRAALDWGLQQEGANLEAALQLVASISLYWVARSYFREGFERLHGYLGRAVEPAHQPNRVKILYRAGAMAGYMFDYLSGRKLCEQAVELARTLGQKRELAGALYYLGEIVNHLDQKQEARAALEESITLCWQENYLNQLSVSLAGMGVFLDQEGNFDGAQSTLEEALAIAQRSNDLWGVGHALLSLGSINRFKRNYDAAIEYFLRSLEATLIIGDRHAEGVTYSNLALLYFVKGNHARAGEYAEKSFAVFQGMGNEYQSPYPLRMMGYSAIHAGNLVRARVLMRESLIGNYGIADTPGQLACLVGLAHCDLAEQDHKSAVQLCALAETHREHNGFSFLEPDAITMETILKQCKRKLGKAAHAAAYQEGQSLKLESILMRLMAE